MAAPEIDVVDPATGELVSLPGLPALPGAHALGLELSPDLTFDQWSAYGATLQTAHRGILWLLGDWLRYGEARWPDRYTQAVDATGRAVQSLMNAAWVADHVDRSRRRDVLSWSHHAEVAAFEPETQVDLLDWCEENDAKRGELRAEIERRGLRPPRAGGDLSAKLAAWVEQGRKLAEEVLALPRERAPAPVPADRLDELSELLTLLDGRHRDGERREAA